MKSIGVAQFVDTNIWVYAHLAGVADPKSQAARGLLEQIHAPVLSTQVLAEYSAEMLRNQMPDRQVQENLEGMMAMCRTQPVSEDTIRRAWAIRSRYGFSFWDSQMVASALEAGCEQIFTEDLQHGQKIAGCLVIQNPFV